jgi:hypothetical protein
MKTLELNQLEALEGGVDGCDISLGLAVTVWSLGFGMVNPLLGAAIGYFGNLAVSEVCEAARK